MHDEQVLPGEPDDASGEGAVSVASEFDIELPFDAGEESAPASDAAAEPQIAPEPTSEQPVEITAAETMVAAAGGGSAPEPPASSGPDGGVATDDPEEATARKLALLAEAEAIVATPDKSESGNAPDDRHLTERMRAVENVWRRVGAAGDREAELRARLQELRHAYAAARSRRAEARAVDRARAGETKRALLVQAFALAQQVDPSIALPAAPAPARAAVRRRPSPAMLARRPAAEAPPAEAPPAEGPTAEPAAGKPTAVEEGAAEPAAADGPTVDGAAAAADMSPEGVGEPQAAPDTVTDHGSAPEDGAGGSRAAEATAGDDNAGADTTTGESVLAHDRTTEA